MIPNPNEFVILPKVPTDGMLASMYNSKDMWDNSQCDNHKELIRSKSAPKYYASISAAPPHNLVAVDKSLISDILDMVEAIHSEPANMPHSEFHLNIIGQLKELLK